MEIIEQIDRAAEYVRARFPRQPQLALVLGSGLGEFHREVVNRVEIPYAEIPHFPVSTVPGHAGKLVLGEIGCKTVAVMAGRFHHYEGYSLAKVTFPFRVLARLGIRTLVATNAAGGIRLDFSPGDLMVIEDHINLMGTNPLIGANHEKWGPRFPDMCTTYTPSLRELAHRVAQELGFSLRQGVYLATTGPSFETPAEIRMMRALGADAVGMSTVPEVIVCRQMGFSVLGISCITNMAAGILAQPITHEEVQEIGDRVKSKFAALLRGIVCAM